MVECFSINPGSNSHMVSPTSVYNSVLNFRNMMYQTNTTVHILENSAVISMLARKDDNKGQ